MNGCYKATSRSPCSTFSCPFQPSVRNSQQGELWKMNGQNAKFDHAITALGFGVLGTVIACFGIVMTVLAYVVEKPSNYKSVAEGYGLRTDIAGPVLLSLGGTGILICAAMVVAGACSTPEWARRKSSMALDNCSEN